MAYEEYFGSPEVDKDGLRYGLVKLGDDGHGNPCPRGLMNVPFHTLSSGSGPSTLLRGLISVAILP